MESVGERLKKIRQEKGLSLEDVQRKTKIHPKILKAIEEDSLVSLSPVYIKGFLKIYCNFLGLDPKEYIPDLKEAVNISGSFVKPLKSPGFKFKDAALKLIRLIQRFLLSHKIKPVLVFIIIFIFAIGLFKLGKSLSSKRSLKLEKKATPASVSPSAESKEGIKMLQIKTAGLIRLDIKANEDCWIELKSDGKVMFRSTLKRGKSESWQAKEKIELSLGNAGVVDLEVNGKRIPALGRRGQVVKNILINKEGLSIQ